MTYQANTEIFENDVIRIDADGDGQLEIINKMSGHSLVVDEDITLSELEEMLNINELEGRTSSLSEDGTEADFEYLRAMYGPANTRNVAPGELVDALESAESGDVLRLHSGEEYDPGEELTIPEDVTLDFNGAGIVPSTDHDVIYCEGGSRLIRPHIDVSNISFTSTCIALDASRYGTYARSLGTQVEIHDFELIADHQDMTGTGLHLNAQDGSISSTSNIQGSAYGFGVGVHLHVDGSSATHMNSNVWRFVLWNCETSILETGGAGRPMESTIYVEAQPTGTGSGSEVLIDNQADRPRSPLYIGRLWDAFYLPDDADAFRGHIRLYTDVNPAALSLISKSDNARGIIITQRRDQVWRTDLNDQVTFRKQYQAGWEQWAMFDGDEYQNTTRYIDVRGGTDQPRFDLRTNTVFSGFRTVEDRPRLFLERGELTIDHNFDGSGQPALVYRTRDGEDGYVWHIDETY